MYFSSKDIAEPMRWWDARTPELQHWKKKVLRNAISILKTLTFVKLVMVKNGKRD